ncbi:MAG: hypothetical protein WB767_17730 [Nocardioides sp.]
MAAPTFVLGLGAQKAGTTWLSDYLRASPQYDFGFRKEYHVLGLVEPATEPARRRALLTRAHEEIELLRRREPCDGLALRAAAMVADLDVYLDYFAGVATAGGQVRATGDLTPGNALIGAELMAHVRDGLQQRGVRTAAVVLLRDPVDRIVSASRMHVQRWPTDGTERPHEAPERVLERFLEPSYARRTRYDLTLAALDQTFDRDACHVGFYETLFRTEETEQICALLGIDHHQADFAHRSNPSRSNEAALPDDVVRQVAEAYRPVYEAVAARFPHLDLAELWPSARWIR